MAEDEVKIKITVDGASAKKELKNIQKEATETGREIESQSRQISNSAFFKGTAIALGLGAIGKGVATLTDSYNTLSGKVEKYSKVKFFTGLEGDKIEKLSKVLEIGGSSIDSFGSAFQSMSKFISGREFGEFDEEMARAFSFLEMYDATQYTEPFDLLIEAIKRLNKETDIGKRNQIAEMLHIPLDVLRGYEEGSKYIDKLYTHSEETKEEIKKLNREIGFLQQNVDTLWEDLASKTITPLKKFGLTIQEALLSSAKGMIEQATGDRKDNGGESLTEQIEERQKRREKTRFRKKVERATPAQRLALLTQAGEDLDIDYLLTGKKNKQSEDNLEKDLNPTQLTIKKQLEERLRKEGFSEEGITGILANVKAESGFNPTIRNPESGALGLFQWLGSRKKDLLQLHDWENPLTQLEFALKEMKTVDGGNVYGLMKHATDKGEATALFEKLFERAKGQLINTRLYYAGVDEEQKNKILQSYYPNFAKEQKNVIQNNYITVKDVEEAKDFASQNLEKNSYVQVTVNNG